MLKLSLAERRVRSPLWKMVMGNGSLNLMPTNSSLSKIFKPCTLLRPQSNYQPQSFPPIPAILWHSGALSRMRKSKNAMFSIGQFKAPGPDGFKSLFFQGNWDVVGPVIISTVKDIFCSGKIPHCLNDTLIVLIPKWFTPETINHLRPLSLCNVVYNLLSILYCKQN